MRAAALAAALLVYGLAGAPAPQAIGGAEAAMAALLVLATGVLQPLLVAGGGTLHRPGCRPWEVAAVLALAVLVWPPLVRGAAQGWEPRQIVRDVVPLLFLFLPAVLVPVLRPAGPRGAGPRGAGPTAAGALAGGLAVAGLLFALRWWQEMEWGFGAVGTRTMPEGTAYFLNAPSVLFAAVALPAAGLAWLVDGGPGKRLAAPLLLAGGALCLAALAGAVHRMALGLAVAALLGIALWWVRRAPWLLALLVPVAVAGLWGAGDAALGAFDQVLEKSRSAGINARGDEAVAVLARVAHSPASLLVGEGWGAVLANPAVGGWRVPYTHTLATYVLFKAGVVGFLALLLWLMTLVPAAWRLVRANPVLAAAVLPPLAMSLGLHTAFKYVDCGLLLTLMVLADEKNEQAGHRQ